MTETKLGGGRSADELKLRGAGGYVGFLFGHCVGEIVFCVDLDGVDGLRDRDVLAILGKRAEDVLVGGLER